MPRHPLFVILAMMALSSSLHWQTRESSDLELDVRYHFNFTHVDPDQIDQFWTVGLNFGFGI